MLTGAETERLIFDGPPDEGRALPSDGRHPRGARHARGHPSLRRDQLAENPRTIGVGRPDIVSAAGAEVVHDLPGLARTCRIIFRSAPYSRIEGAKTLNQLYHRHFCPHGNGLRIHAEAFRSAVDGTEPTRHIREKQPLCRNPDLEYHVQPLRPTDWGAAPQDTRPTVSSAIEGRKAGERACHDNAIIRRAGHPAELSVHCRRPVACARAIRHARNLMATKGHCKIQADGNTARRRSSKASMNLSAGPATSRRRSSTRWEPARWAATQWQWVDFFAESPTDFWLARRRRVDHAGHRLWQHPIHLSS